jgi:hypothetical protein
MYVGKIVSINKPQDAAAQDRIQRGIDFLCDAVKQTLGPHGRNFLMEKGLKITNDGISIAKEIQLKDEIEDVALRITREAAIKTNDAVGDGTTTALTLVQAIYKEAIRLLPGKHLAGKLKTKTNYQGRPDGYRPKSSLTEIHQNDRCRVLLINPVSEIRRCSFRALVLTGATGW